MSAFCGRCGTPYREGDQFCGKCGTPREAGPLAPQPVMQQQPAAAMGSAGTPKKPSIARLILPIFIVGAVGAGMFFTMSDCGSTEGNVRVAGARGNFTFTPTGCASMQPYGRFGANLHGDGNNDGAVYVTVDPTRGTLVEIEVPGSCRNSDGTDCTVFPVPRDRCSVYEAHVENTGTVVNDVRLVEGNVRLQCELEDGTTVQGRVVFDGC